MTAAPASASTAGLLVFERILPPDLLAASTPGRRIGAIADIESGEGIGRVGDVLYSLVDALYDLHLAGCLLGGTRGTELSHEGGRVEVVALLDDQPFGVKIECPHLMHLDPSPAR